MFSPSTFIGIANAIGSIITHAPSAGRAAGVQPVRSLTTPPVTAPAAQPMPKSGVAGPSGQQAAPPRNLPRGSLLDLSV
jgi:hypothetical protein